MKKKIRLLDLTFETPEENLAVEDVLLDWLEHDLNAPEVLRLWEPNSPFVVLGRSCKFFDEVNHDYCQQHAIPIFRRSSGGGTVVAGPGCLMYSVVLRYESREHLRMLDQAHQFVMEHVHRAVESCGVTTSIEGTSDLAVHGRKVSGNAMRCGRNVFLYHGTLLYGMDPDLIENCLGKPARQPDYREQRNHKDFVATLPCSASELRKAMINSWQTELLPVDFPRWKIPELVTERYSLASWNRKL